MKFINGSTIGAAMLRPGTARRDMRRLRRAHRLRTRMRRNPSSAF
ncbi:hypothetical protein A33K_13612 [Burkholderia humptydooensis MSMB43]|uniref:Uncharacterized protein n=1 Tax=Burkholderia humptydooensis MSMB43 TaxID=441157 RepID=A0ABN0GCY8_9BURK|nr:hypothetical protein A33K_13612 [Burkholderia humptydooensis MSMB43]